MLCQHQEIQGQPPNTQFRYVRCIHCGELAGPTNFPVESFQEVNPKECLRPTKKTLQPLPPFWERILNYAEAYAQHLRAGSQSCTPEEILERFRHCSRCELYNDLVGACCVCGCFVNLMQPEDGPNACGWKDYSCPKNPPEWDKLV